MPQGGGLQPVNCDLVSASSCCVHTCTAHAVTWQWPACGQGRVHLQTPIGPRTLTGVLRPTCRSRWSPAPHPHAVYSGFCQSLPAGCLTRSPGALQLGWPAVWRWTCVGGQPQTGMVGTEAPAGSTDWSQIVPWDPGGPHSHTELSLTSEPLIPWG